MYPQKCHQFLSQDSAGFSTWPDFRYVDIGERRMYGMQDNGTLYQ